MAAPPPLASTAFSASRTAGRTRAATRTRVTSPSLLSALLASP